MQAIQSHYWAVRDYLSPVLRESKFKEHGRITPEEFVAAGDFLAYKFPVWTWEKGDPTKARDYLPGDKQYLVTRGVPCLRRATSLAYTDADEDAERLVSFGESTAAGSTMDSAANPGEIDDIPDLDAQDPDSVAAGVGSMSLALLLLRRRPPDLDDIPDMEEDDLEAGDDATAAPKVVRQNRPYWRLDPRVWLIGYDENQTPLTPSQIFQDISADHANKTVTIEPFIHSTSLQAASVHPCKHASVMKKVIERMNNSVVEEQLAHRKASAPGTASKEPKKKWPFSRKVSGSVKDDKPASSAHQSEEEEVEGMRGRLLSGGFLKFIASIVPR
ncbi:autophagocytosis associated protein [Infundibulicybe gibba]|nr:autophagocytosis associated protein [Infundibulicybe gibba]